MEPMKNTTAFRPNKGRYLILPDAVKSQETKIEGSAYTIDQARDIHEKPSEGTVIAKGNDCTEYEPGAKVLYGKYSGYEQLFDGTNYLILAETEILGERLVTPFDDEPPAERSVRLTGDCTLCKRPATTTGLVVLISHDDTRESAIMPVCKWHKL